MKIIKHFITSSALDWAQKEKENANSLAAFIINTIEKTNKLRDAQIEALKVYLWLKCQNNNKTLLEVLEQQYSDREGGRLKTLLFDLADEVESEKLKKYAKIATEEDIKSFFGDFLGGYDGIPTWLFSLPMGAGKTFVMAAMIYIDLYFNLTTEDRRFAKNFLIFAPSGLKNSVIPSLRSIEHFDATWILPQDIVEQIKKQLKFIVLDVNKTEKKSNRIENPNARKVQECLTELHPSGYVFVTNAEKVILDRIVEDPYKGMLFEQDDDEKSKQANELRHLLGKVPSMSVFIDEVHHNQQEENKLRLVIDKYFSKESIVSVVGFTGTPYFKKKIILQNITLNLDQIPDTVYHYELKNGVRNFLKQPIIKSFTSDTETIVRTSLEDFYQRYYTKAFKDGRKPKLAIYCATIEKLEEEVLPIVIKFYQEKGLDTNEILKYYGSSAKSKTGKEYTLEKDAEVEFRKLDTSYSTKRIILLCQIGKEGWDCQSLCGVVLSGEGDSPKNMVLQTSCRCLREVDDAKNEVGLIYLNDDNYKHLEKELRDEHNISIKEFEEGQEEKPILKRVDRRAYLKLPPIAYNQFVVEYEYVVKAQAVNTQERLDKLTDALRSKEQPFYRSQIVTTRAGFDLEDKSGTTLAPLSMIEIELSYSQFIYEILKASLGTIHFDDLKEFGKILKEIYLAITISGKYNNNFDLSIILSSIIQACIPESSVVVKEKIDPQKVEWLVSDINKNPLQEKAKIYPESIDLINKISEYDAKNMVADELLKDEDEKIKKLEETKNMLGGNRDFVRTVDQQIKVIEKSKLPLKNKDVSFQYIPYDFTQSEFEKDVLEEIFQLPLFQEKKLEVYFNGDRFLSTFKVKIYRQIEGTWKLIQDKYTPDFLVIKRDAKNKIEKSLILETKGAHLAQDFHNIKEFMESKFKEINRDAFDYLYLESGRDIRYYIGKIHDKIQEYFE